MINSPQTSSFWADIIRAVRSPLGFFSLIILITELILASLAQKATGLDFTILIGGMILIILTSIIVVAIRGNYYQRLQDENGENECLTSGAGAHKGRDSGSLTKVDQQCKYDLFLSAPMAAYENNEQYRASRAEVKKVFDAFKDYCEFKIYWSGEEIENIWDFDTQDASIINDLRAVKQSKYFCLIYPEKIVTSALFEAGYALAYNKFSVYFVKKRSDLPFLMRDAGSVFTNVRIHNGDDWESSDDIVRVIRRNREQLFITFGENT
jgi:hypothetical protein